MLSSPVLATNKKRERDKKKNMAQRTYSGGQHSARANFTLPPHIQNEKIVVLPPVAYCFVCC